MSDSAPLAPLLILNAYGTQNRGDDWIVQAMRRFLPGEAKYAACDGAVDAAEVNIVLPWAVPPERSRLAKTRALAAAAGVFVLPRAVLRVLMPEVARSYLACRLAVSKGGSFLLAWKGITGWAYLISQLAPIRLAQRLGLPVIIAGQSIGPFATKPQSFLARRVLSRCNAVLARDPVTAANIPGARLVPDIVMTMTTDQLAVIERQQNRRRDPFLTLPQPYVALSVVGDAYFTNNLGPDAEDALVDALHDYARVNNLAIQPFTQVTGPTAGDDDRPVLRRIARRLSDLGLCVGEVDERPTDLRVLEHARLVVSIRMHTAIASLIHGRPTVVLSYLSPKVTGLKQFAHGVAIVEDAHFARNTLTRCFVSVEAASAGVSTEAAEIWAREISQWL